MRTGVYAVTAALACAFFLDGCSVKEDRDSCPCRLVLDFTGTDTSMLESAELRLESDEGFRLESELDSDDLRSEIQISVPRGPVKVAVWGGTEGLLRDGDLLIPPGMDCPPVRFHISELDADCESVREMVVMRKNHCRMTINLKNEGNPPESLEIHGNVCGYMRDGKPAEGEFRCMLEGEGDSGYVVVLPRQTDDSLVLEFADGGEPVRRFNIGFYISESGYDWDEPDLKDLALEIDVVVSEVRLAVQGREMVYRYDLVI